MTLLLTLLSACDGTADDTADPGFSPDLHCPGAAGCETATGPLSAGAAAVTITPTCFEGWIDPVGEGEWDKDFGWLDCGCDRLCAGDDGYPGPDEGEGDDDFQAFWLAGFHNGRPASGVRDDIWARTLVFDQGDTRVAIVALDVVGWFYDEVLRSRQDLAATDLGIDLLVVHATHNHEAPDTLGIWGQTETRSGRNDTWQAEIRDKILESVTLAVADLREVAELKVGRVDVQPYHELGVLNLLQDKRDPFIVDHHMNALQVTDTSGDTIATIGNFGNHPEAMADENTLITSDFPHAFRETLEQGVAVGDVEIPAYGGVAIWWSAAVGGMMTPLGITTTDLDGTEYREYTFEKTDALGRVKASLAHEALAQATPATSMDLQFTTTTMKFPVDNYGFQAMFLSGIFDRALYDYDSSQIIEEGNVPNILTELVHLQLGPLELLTIPGELLPELAIGGYDGSSIGTHVDPIVASDNPNPPDLTQAPEGPYLKDRMSGEHKWLLGLANDEIGYIVPPYNFILDDVNPYFDEPEGDHYEETNSLGIDTAPLLDARVAELMAWVQAQ